MPASLASSIEHFFSSSERFRARVNRPGKHKSLTESPDWLRICSCMDVIGDTTQGLLAYAKYLKRVSRAKRLKVGQSEYYLVIYGVLQLIYVQQDALVTLAKVFRISFQISDFPQHYPAMNKARALRNASVGHPTSIAVHGKSVRGCSFISRGRLTPDTFDVEIASQGTAITETFFVPELIVRHLREARAVLLRIGRKV